MRQQPAEHRARHGARAHPLPEVDVVWTPASGAGIDADAGEEEAAAARIIIRVVVFMCRRWCRSEGGAEFAAL